MPKKILKISIPKDWVEALKKNNLDINLDLPIKNILNELENNKKIAPNINNIFRAFELCDYESTKVVIFGQDPYFQTGFANGLAFSVNENFPIPASLKNIYSEIRNDIGRLQNSNGCLKGWAKDGVLLLNSSLTVEISKPSSHSKIGWRKFINNIVKLLSDKKNVVFILWGNHAQSFKHLINQKENLVLCSSHPSPLSAHRGFFGNNHFSKCNQYLVDKKIQPIKW
tara:strand:+ start:52 stop:729 length:678 start_codon:yes stop_codon:yes gene_type:complete